jgi:hypothetical protein
LNLKISNRLWATAALVVFSTSATRADSLFTLTGSNPSLEMVPSASLTVNGITATLVALVNNAPGGQLNSNTSEFGVNAAGSADIPGNIDAALGNAEAVRITFDQPVFFNQLVLALYTPSAADLATLTLPDSSPTLTPQTSAIDTYNFTTGNLVNVGEPVTLAYSAGNGFSFNSFTVEAVPLPTAAWGALALLGGLSATKLIRRHRLSADR